MAGLFSWGTPLLFFLLVRRFKHRGEHGDKQVRAALGWAYLPYRNGREFWFSLEMVRILLLTSFIGFMSSSCEIKMVVAQIIGMAFFGLFLWLRPYRRKSNNIAQAVTMVVPIVGMSYALAGRGLAKDEATPGNDSDASFDTIALVVLHSVLILPPIVMGIFSVFSTLWVWR